jgi:16S rRNA (uracil1498-N3)-methyltransferase
MRLKAGDMITVFNGKDGEWQAIIEPAGKKSLTLQIQSQLRQQKYSPDVWLLCTPLKNSRTDGVVEKATELGVSRICPVTTRYTNIDKVNGERLHAIAIEAAEQSERLDIPAIEPLQTLEKMLGNWPAGRTLLYGDESGKGTHPSSITTTTAHAVLVGPEGGFAPEEFALLRTLPFARAITLGPRILRADTAAIAMLTLVQAATGDWDQKPAFRSEEKN